MPKVLIPVRVPRLGMVAMTIATLFACSVLIADERPATAAGKDTEDTVQIFERDVFFINGASLRNPTSETPDDEELFNDSGVALSVTWGQWNDATADSSVVVTGGPHPKTHVRIELAGLIPNGVYSVFYGTLTPDSEHPQCPGVERTLPVTSSGPSKRGPDASSPDASSFVADAAGTARFVGQIEGDFLDPLQAFFSIVYHSDGMTYHPFPNAGEYQTHDGEFGCRSSFGQDAMRQLIIFQKF